MRKINPGDNYYRVPKKTKSISIDILLQRASNASQFLLLIITLASFYFIVIPLYEKELLSEQVARKEIELTELQRKIQKHRLDETRVWVSHKLIDTFSYCSGLLKVLPQEKASVLNDRMLVMLSDNAETCFSEKFPESEVPEFVDKELFLEFHEDYIAAAANVESARKVAYEKYKNFEYHLTGNELPLAGVDLQIFNLYLKTKPNPEQRRKALERTYGTIEKGAIASGYSRIMQLELMNLQNKWLGQKLIISR